MNTKLVESLAQVILSLSEEERNLLYSKINVKNVSSSIPLEVLDLEKRLKTFESQYQMSSETFYQRFRAGELGDAMDFFEWRFFMKCGVRLKAKLNRLKRKINNGTSAVHQ